MRSEEKKFRNELKALGYSEKVIDKAVEEYNMSTAIDLLTIIEKLDEIFQNVYWRYGLSLVADITDEEGVERIYIMEGRHGEHPISFDEWFQFLDDEEQHYVLFNAIDLLEEET